MSTNKENNTLRRLLKATGSVILCVLSLCLMIPMIGGLAFGSENTPAAPEPVPSVSVIDSFDSFVSGNLSEAEEAARTVRKRFWIEQDAILPPEPRQEHYGQAQSAAELQWLLDEAQPLLDGQDTLFHTGIEILEGSVINYYLDESILAITWKQVMDNFVYTISEVKIQDPSQFRRYVADNQFDLFKYYHTTEMSEMNNAVVASSADFYKNRNYGIVVYDKEVKRVTVPNLADTCFIDVNGDLIFTYRGELMDEETAQKFVDDNEILFSLAFGPILVDNGVRCEPPNYALGEINDPYPRAALCQMDKLHYLVVAATAEGRFTRYTDIHDFAKNIATFGCQKAYTLDGGRTVTIAMNHQLINKVNYGEPRSISDIIFFATAVPNYNEAQ